MVVVNRKVLSDVVRNLLEGCTIMCLFHDAVSTAYLMRNMNFEICGKQLFWPVWN